MNNIFLALDTANVTVSLDRSRIQSWDSDKRNWRCSLEWNDEKYERKLSVIKRGHDAELTLREAYAAFQQFARQGVPELFLAAPIEAYANAPIEAEFVSEAPHDILADAHFDPDLPGVADEVMRGLTPNRPENSILGEAQERYERDEIPF